VEGDPVWEKTVEELMEAVDSYIPTAGARCGEAFLMPVEDIFSDSGRGTVGHGQSGAGQVK